MKTWLRRTLLGFLGASIVFGGLAACGHRYERHGWSELSTEERAKVRGKVLDRVASKLQLDAAQKQRLATLADKLEAQRTAFMGQSTYPRQELRSLVAGEKFDRAKAQALVSEKTAAVQARSPEVIAALADFYDSLNPAQQTQVREFMDKRRRWRP